MRQVAGDASSGPAGPATRTTFDRPPMDAPPPTLAPSLGRPIRAYGFDRRKTWPFVAMLLVMIGLGLFWLATRGFAEAWGLFVVLVLLPGVALAMVLGELRLAGPVLVVGEGGLLDRRHGPEPVPWSAIQEATLKGRVLNKGIRIVLTDGRRYDIELNLLAADPYELMRVLQDQARRGAG
jgi:hypothetical protein